MMMKMPVAAALLLWASAASAQAPSAATCLPVTSTDSTATAGSFQKLSPGEQKKARALFEAQHPGAKSAAPLSLDQIAMLRTQQDWDRIVAQMRAQGLVQATALGEIIGRPDLPARQSGRASITAGTVVVTTGNGSTRTIAAASARAPHQDD